MYLPCNPRCSVLDEFASEANTDRVAELIEICFGGSYAAACRREARRIAHQEYADGGYECP